MTRGIGNDLVAITGFDQHIFYGNDLRGIIHPAAHSILRPYTRTRKDKAGEQEKYFQLLAQEV